MPSAAKDQKDYGGTVTDMPSEMQAVALSKVQEALKEGKTENEAVCLVKEFFDREAGPTWHCILGRNFGSKVTHESKTFFYVTVNKQLKMLLFKS
mmetsp:Transcript_25207/g.44817  ORF Transcript_25207/g.44817 Transcript_25207/m.44817 type:complete len:95 (+) Transcript_25207:354-638(+)|eukprot:CAMPEP_0197519396 /NCGR_PEP_ID=MMETSP1318-20131121/4668_1 /TAXON_ID=552666 /ORGANISM="Partenskyella glossopodia, Strain RCC365" /LENGTH=94 /DNA_ID=CAMNT_0043070355 /DNA_START=304 /DNA_END=588 /DNA_ORIENTATION=+